MSLERLSTKSFLREIGKRRTFHVNDINGRIYIPLGIKVKTKLNDYSWEIGKVFQLQKSLDTYLCFEDYGGVIGYSLKKNFFDEETGSFHLNTPIILHKGKPNVDFTRLKKEISLNDYLYNLKCLIIHNFPYERVYNGNV